MAPKRPPPLSKKATRPPGPPLGNEDDDDFSRPVGGGMQGSFVSTVRPKPPRPPLAKQQQQQPASSQSPGGEDDEEALARAIELSLREADKAVELSPFDSSQHGQQTTYETMQSCSDDHPRQSHDGSPQVPSRSSLMKSYASREGRSGVLETQSSADATPSLPQKSLPPVHVMTISRQAPFGKHPTKAAAPICRESALNGERRAAVSPPDTSMVPPCLSDSSPPLRPSPPLYSVGTSTQDLPRYKADHVVSQRPVSSFQFESPRKPMPYRYVHSVWKEPWEDACVTCGIPHAPRRPCGVVTRDFAIGADGTGSYQRESTRPYDVCSADQYHPDLRRFRYAYGHAVPGRRVRIVEQKECLGGLCRWDEVHTGYIVGHEYPGCPAPRRPVCQPAVPWRPLLLYYQSHE